MISASLILYHNRQSDIDRVLDSVISSNIELLQIVDHSNTNGFEELKNRSERIRYVKTDNDGYGSGHNIGFKLSQEGRESKYHIVLNPDVYFDPDAIHSLETFMEMNPDIGLVMPKVFYPDGRFQYLCKLLPTPSDIFLRQFAPRSIRERNDKRYTLTTADFSKEMDVPSLSGCFMFFRTSVFKEIGGFDERYFMHFEDIDISRRVGDIARTVYYPGATIVHAHEAAHKKNKKMLIIGLQSAVKYFNKWGWLFDEERSKRNNRAMEYLRGFKR